MWKPYVRFSSFCSGMGAASAAPSHSKYLTRDGECVLWEMESRGRKIHDRKKAAERWKRVAKMETGILPLDTPAGRSRHDACVQVRLFLPLPNLVFSGMKEVEMREALNLLVASLKLDSSDIMWALHGGRQEKGKGKKEQNLHLHVSYRPRSKEGKKHRISIRKQVVLLRKALGEWLEDRGYEIDWQSVKSPGKRRHISPAKIAMAEKGLQLHCEDEKLQAGITLARRKASEFTRELAREIILKAAKSEDPTFSRIEEEMNARGWSIAKVKRGKRTTWVIEDEAGKEMAVRRILDCKEKMVSDLFNILKAEDEERKEQAKPPQNEQPPKAIDTGKNLKTNLKQTETEHEIPFL